MTRFYVFLAISYILVSIICLFQTIYFWKNCYIMTSLDNKTKVYSGAGFLIRIIGSITPFVNLYLMLLIYSDSYNYVFLKKDDKIEELLVKIDDFLYERKEFK